MRSIIIGLSVVFFSLSALIMLKALELPAQTPLANIPLVDLPITNAPPTSPPADQDSSKAATSESSAPTQNPAEPQDASNAVVADLEATIAQLKDKLTVSEKTIENIKATNIENHSRTVTVFGGQTFRSGHDVINEAAASKIEKLISEISVFPNSLITIEGHTDNIPIGKLHKNNMDLSIRRAKTIANILISRGIPQERISVIGYGDTRPIDTNSTEEGRAKNRRVEVKLMFREGGN
jgi:flagellar motor protein MotB